MPTFVLPNVGIANQPFQFATMPAQGTTPSNLLIKNTTAAYIYNGTVLQQITDPDYPAKTVWGCAYLDGTFYVMSEDGRIWGCNIMDPFNWSALNFISANARGDKAVALTRYLQYIIAFKESTTEVFYDAGNPAPGSPLSKMTSGLMDVGCSHGGSIAFSDNVIFFMSQTLAKGRGITKMEGFTPQKISTPFIDRILDADDLSGVYSFVLKSNGHVFYVLTLKGSKLTLVYDDVTHEWHRWTSLKLDQPVPAETTTVNGITTFTVTERNPLIQTMLPYTTANALPGHGMEDGDPIQLFGQLLPITYISPTQFSVVSAQPVPPSVVYTPYAESYFPGVYYTRGSNVDLLLSEDGAVVYQFSPDLYQDAGNPINTKVRTSVEDWGTMSLKFFRRLEVVGDIEDTMLQVRTTDNDYQTWSQYRQIFVAQDRAQLRALGSGRRRAHELRHFDNTPLRLIALEADFDVGAR